jgi:hypothetical protein
VKGATGLPSYSLCARSWNNADASSLLYEPPYTEPYVRWCGRTAGVTRPTDRSGAGGRSRRQEQEGAWFCAASSLENDTGNTFRYRLAHFTVCWPFWLCNRSGWISHPLEFVR